MESASLRYTLGRWDDALLDLETVVALADEFQAHGDTSDPGGIVSCIAHHRGDDETIDGAASQQPRAGIGPTVPATLHLVTALDRGDLDGARRGAREILIRIDGPGPSLRREFEWLP